MSTKRATVATKIAVRAVGRRRSRLSQSDPLGRATLPVARRACGCSARWPSYACMSVRLPTFTSPRSWIDPRRLRRSYSADEGFARSRHSLSVGSLPTAANQAASGSGRFRAEDRARRSDSRPGRRAAFVIVRCRPTHSQPWCCAARWCDSELCSQLASRLAASAADRSMMPVDLMQLGRRARRARPEQETAARAARWGRAALQGPAACPTPARTVDRSAATPSRTRCCPTPTP